MGEREREKMMERMIERGRKRKGDEMRSLSCVFLNSLGLSIFFLLNSSSVSIDPRSRTVLIFALEVLKSLQKYRDCMESKMMKAVEEKIRDDAWELENVLDSHVSDQFLSQSEAERRTYLFFLDLEGIKQDIDGFVEKVMKMKKLWNPWSDLGGGGIEIGMFGSSDQCGLTVTRRRFMSRSATKAASISLGMKEDYVHELEKLLPGDEEDDDYAALTTSCFSRSKSTDFSSILKEKLITSWTNEVASTFAMAREYAPRVENPLPQYDDDDDELAAIVPSGTESVVNMVGLSDFYCKVRDDVCMKNPGTAIGAIVGMAGIGKTAIAKKNLQDPLVSSKFEYRIFVRVGQKMQPKEIKQAILAQIPDADEILMEGEGNVDDFLREFLKVRKCLIVLDDVWNRGLWNTMINKIYLWEQSWILVTTRINEVARNLYGMIYDVPFLNKKESWDLLCNKIFAEKGCRQELEKAGEKIAENCEGLPLLILAVVDLLSKAERTPGYWIKVAANKTNSIFVEAYDQLSEVVYPSYSDLPPHLKACFLYLGAFPQNDEVRVSKLIGLWSADGFLGVSSYALLQRNAGEFLKEIVSDNVALGTQWSDVRQRLKACSLHSVFWYLCKREAGNEKFLHVLNSYTDASVEGIESQRRLSIYKNSIFSIKGACDSIASISNVHSLLCTGPYHQYQVPVCLDLRLLKVLEALSVRFYEFPIEVVKLFQLRYLALTCNGNLPPSISKLWSLQSLILHPHLSIKSSVSQSSYLPVEIWDLQELEYLQIMGKNLPDPPPGVVLRKLLILLDVGANTCTERVIGSIPKLEKLRVRIELMPDSAEPLRFCDDIKFRLRGIRSLQFVVINPELMLKTAVPPPLFSIFLNFRKLTLSGCGYRWEDMNSMTALLYLEVLKLKCYAFQGEKWHVTKETRFHKLSYLSIEDTDLVQWTGENRSFPALSFLAIKNCYKLREIPNVVYAGEIQVVDCNPSVVACVKKMAGPKRDVFVESSWLEDKKLS